VASTDPAVSPPHANPTQQQTTHLRQGRSHRLRHPNSQLRDFLTHCQHATNTRLGFGGTLRLTKRSATSSAVIGRRPSTSTAAIDAPQQRESPSTPSRSTRRDRRTCGAQPSESDQGRFELLNNAVSRSDQSWLRMRNTKSSRPRGPRNPHTGRAACVTTGQHASALITAHTHTRR